jgi:tetratricopeptide (TPR) repeat protein
MLRHLCFVTLWLAACLFAQDEVVPTIPQLTKDGDAAYLKGDYETARQTFTRAWELAQQTPKDNPERYAILKRLTSVRAAAGEFADADNWLQQAITWRENTRGQNDHGIPDDLLISVGLCRGMKDFDRALVILRRVQSLHVEAYTADSPMVADDFSRIGGVYAEQKQIHDAVSAIDAALLIRTKLGGPLDPALIPDLDRLGEYHTMLRDYPLAEAAYRHVLVIRETLYGKTHADLIATVDGLAYALFGQHKYDEADPVYQRLIGLWEFSVGKDHPMVAVALDKLAVFYAARKKYPETRDVLERSSAIRARFLAMGISQQATQAFTEGHPDQVKTFYQRGLAVLEPPSPINEDLRGEFEGMLKALDVPPPRKAPAPAKKADKL